MIDFDVLRSVQFGNVEVKRTKYDLASPTDIEVSIQQTPIAVMAGSVLELRIPKE